MTMFCRILAGILLALALALPASAPATVSTSANKTIVSGNGSNTVFTFTFIAVAAADITVTYTDTSGNQTVLTQGSGTTQYQISLNAPVQGALWGVGGTVTYNPSGTPIASGTTLTIMRTLPLTQAVVLRNQSSVQTLGSGAETAIDTAVMQGQQVSEQIGRALQANAANSAPPAPLPPAAQVAGQGLCFDGTGNNVIGCVLPSSGVISSAMAPVVSAASLSAGRTALGLGTMALEAINSGTCGGTTIQDDGSGNARVQFATAADSTNQSVSCAFHGTQRVATGALVYTFARANTLFNGFGFTINALTANVTLTANASDNFVVFGVAGSSGGSTTIPAGTTVQVSTNAASSGAWYVTITDPLTPRNYPGFEAPINLQLNASVAANALTIAVKNSGGNDPSALSPVVGAFRDPTVANGDPIVRSIAAALSITVPSGATLGTVSAQANRLWVAWNDNAATPVLCVYNSLNSTGPSILPWDETSVVSGTGITSGSTSAQTWYCSSSTTTTSFRILGYVEAKQTTAGTWATAPSKIQLYGPGVKRPSESVQRVSSLTTGGSATTTSASFVALTGATLAIAPLSAANIIHARTGGTVSLSASDAGILQMSRGSVNNTGLFGESHSSEAGAAFNFTVQIEGDDIPNTTSSTTYAVQGKTKNGNTLSYGHEATFGNLNYGIVLEEIQI